MQTVATSPSAADLFERYGQELYRFCYGRLRNPEDAADAIQNTFLRVHVALEKGTVPEYEAAWLYKIAHNVCLSRIEQSGRRAQHERPTDFDGIEVAAAEHDHDRLEGLADALSELPHNLRQSLLLREWQGLSYAEIAEALDTTVPAVESLLYRARKQLAQSLEQGGRKVRTVLGGIVDLFGIRALLSGAGAAKLAVGAALLAAGGAGIGSAVAVESVSPKPAPRLLRHVIPAVAPVPARGLSADAPSTVSLSRRHVIAPVAGPTAAQPTPPPMTLLPPAAARAPSAAPSEQHAAPTTTASLVTPPAAPVVNTPATPTATLPSVPSVSTPSLPTTLPSLPSAPQLPVETPTLPNLGG